MNIQVFEITPADEVMVSKDGSVYVVEASSLEMRNWPRTVLFQGKQFTYYKSDMSDGGEDLAGMRYRYMTEELLIIND